MHCLNVYILVMSYKLNLVIYKFFCLDTLLQRTKIAASLVFLRLSEFFVIGCRYTFSQVSHQMQNLLKNMEASRTNRHLHYEQIYGNQLIISYYEKKLFAKNKMLLLLLVIILKITYQKIECSSVVIHSCKKAKLFGIKHCVHVVSVSISVFTTLVLLLD